MPEKNTNKRLILQIYGFVQGVFYRWESRKKAKELGLVGWVKNLPDGTVKIVAEGETEKLEELKSWCEIGPKFAKVERVEETQEEATGEFKEFEVR